MRDFVPEPMCIASYDVSILQAVHPMTFPLPRLQHPLLYNTFVCPEGLINKDGDLASHWFICCSCDRYLSQNKLPPTALVNDLFLGIPPPELSDLTIIEEALIAHQ